MVNEIPKTIEDWPRKSHGRSNGDQDDDSRIEIDRYTHSKSWHSVEQQLYFFCDLHADADAFSRSLLASGGVKQIEKNNIELTTSGKLATFVIGGDCFDKGPSTLKLLDLVSNLRRAGAKLIILAGNHDVRTYLGLFYAGSNEPALDHLFIRMGPKVVPFLKELYLTFSGKKDTNGLTSYSAEERIKEILLPSEDWESLFTKAALDTVKPQKLKKEIKRTKEKTVQFQVAAEEFNLTFSQIKLAIDAFKAEFIDSAGQYYWFFNTMQLLHREGSYLFLHAGLDDVMAEKVSMSVDEMNHDFHELFLKDPFTLYHGPIGNIFRTKYRESDFDFTAKGSEFLHNAGIYALVHGHRNILHGQRVVIRESMLNFECDASVDKNTRALVGLKGKGAAVVIFENDGSVKGISTDYPHIKSFKPG